MIWLLIVTALIIGPDGAVENFATEVKVYASEAGCVAGLKDARDTAKTAATQIEKAGLPLPKLIATCGKLTGLNQVRA